MQNEINGHIVLVSLTLTCLMSGSEEKPKE